jgi:hypothetical protein
MTRPDRILLLALLLGACGSSDSKPCKAALTATFETIPNGELPGNLVVGGISITQGSDSAVQIIRDMPDPSHNVPVLFLGQAGRVIVLPGCDAHMVELAFNDSEQHLGISLFGAENGGGLGQDGGDAPASLMVDSRTLNTVPDTAPGYKRATLMLSDGSKIRRLELVGTNGNPDGSTGALVRLIGFDP